MTASSSKPHTVNVDLLARASKLGELELLEREVLAACLAVGASVRKGDGDHLVMARLIECCVALDKKSAELGVTP